MQNESIVLEMFSRIKALEEKAEAFEVLENRIDTLEKRIEKLEQGNVLSPRKATAEEYYEQIKRLMKEYDDLKILGKKPNKSKRDYVGEKLKISGRQVTNILNKYENPSDKNKKEDITDAMIQKCYAAGKSIYEDESLKLWDLANTVGTQTGMNKNSAYFSIYAVRDLLSGSEYRISIGAEHIEKFLNYIKIDYGKNGLEKATKSLDEYIEYKQQQGHPLKKLVTVNNKYKQCLKG